MNKPGLTRSEWTLMHAVWRLGPATVRDVHDDVTGETAWAYSTTKTLLDRMHAKGLLQEERVGNVKVFTAAMTPKQLLPHAVRDFLDTALDGSLAPLVPYIAKNRKLSEAEVKRLRKLLEDEE